jgi:predicted kinase
VPRLIVLNGPPACGKSTLARRYAEEHPLTLDLDIDRIRDLIGGWRTHLADAGLLARAAALAAARAHLLAGHDVIVPQLLARPEFLIQAEELARSTGATFHEIVLMDTRENAVRRWSLRAAGTPVRDGQEERRGEPGDTPETIAALHDRLLGLLPSRPNARIVHSHENQIDRTHQEFLAHLDGR